MHRIMRWADAVIVGMLARTELGFPLHSRMAENIGSKKCRAKEDEMNHSNRM
jgi:hypothetical protein